MKKNTKIPKKNFFKCYKIRVSNCMLIVNVWRCECFFDRIIINDDQQIVTKNQVNKMPMPNLLEIILEDPNFWKSSI